MLGRAHAVDDVRFVLAPFQVDRDPVNVEFHGHHSLGFLLGALQTGDNLSIVVDIYPAGEKSIKVTPETNTVNLHAEGMRASYVITFFRG